MSMDAFIPKSKPPPPPKRKVPGRKRVFVCSPLRPRKGRTIEQNIELAKRLCVAALKAGVAPWASHIFYPSIGLGDADVADRNAGTACGLRWLGVADEVWCWAASFDDCSEGMKREIEAAQLANVPVKVVYRDDIPCWKDIAP